MMMKPIMMPSPNTINTLADLTAMLLHMGRQLPARVDSDLDIQPLTGDFDPEFRRLFEDE